MRVLPALLSLIALSAPALVAEASRLRISGVAEVTSVEASLGSDVQPGDRILFSLTYNRKRVVDQIGDQIFGPVFKVEFVALGSGGTFAATAEQGRAGIENDVPIGGAFIDSYAFGSYTDVQGDSLNGFAPTFIDLFVRESGAVPPDLVTDESLPSDPVGVLSSGPSPASVRMTYGANNVFGNVTALSSVPIPEPSAALLFAVGGTLVARALGRRRPGGSSR